MAISHYHILFKLYVAEISEKYSNQLLNLKFQHPHIALPREAEQCNTLITVAHLLVSFLNMGTNTLVWQYKGTVRVRHTTLKR